MFKGLLAIAGSFLLIKYRERIVDATGKFEWAEKYLGTGGTYNLMVILGVLFFVWGLSAVTGTTDVLLGPLRYVLAPGSVDQGGGAGDEWGF